MRAVAIAIALAALPLAAQAQRVDDSAISRLINAGQIDAARAAFEQGNPSEAERLFFDGRLQKATGQFDAAIASFRAALLADPALINARRELAHTLLLAEDYRASEFHFRALLDIDTNPQMRAGYRRFLGAIDANRPLLISGFGAVLPSTNVNRGSQNAGFDTTLGRFVIDPGSRAQSGVGFRFGLSGQFRQRLEPGSRAILDWSLARTLYSDDTFNAWDATVGLTVERITQTARWSIGGYQRRTWEADDGDIVATGVRANLRQSLGDGLSGTVSLLGEVRDYRNSDTQDGPFFAATVGLTRQFGPSVALSGGLTYERSLPELEHLRYAAYGITADLSRSWDGGLFTRIDLSAGIRDFDTDFPLTTSPRADEYARIGLDLRAPQIDIAGFLPTLRCAYTINRSNVSLYDYTTTECQVGISRNF